MASMGMTKVTMTLDDEAVRQLELTAKRLRQPKSEIARRAIIEFAGQGPRHEPPTPEEWARRKAILDRIAALPPSRSQAEVEAELREIREARRLPGRLTPVE
ncbi:MAG: ribbon-helix-helix protein, CopG family [Bryobacteraceae bacterium]|nr:ribbon-helix-helix protein, CopG family [Bryobacteraceae bacterium]